MKRIRSTETFLEPSIHRRISRNGAKESSLCSPTPRVPLMGSRTDCCHLFSFLLLFCPSSSLPTSGSLQPSIHVRVYLLPAVWHLPASSLAHTIARLYFQRIYIQREKLIDPFLRSFARARRERNIDFLDNTNRSEKVREKEGGKRIERNLGSRRKEGYACGGGRGEEKTQRRHGWRDNAGIRGSSRPIIAFFPPRDPLASQKGGFSHGNGGHTTLGLIERNAVTIPDRFSLFIAILRNRWPTDYSPLLASLPIQPLITKSLSPTCYPFSQ